MNNQRQVVMSPTEISGGKRRARMGGADKTPDSHTPRKRKPLTKTRTTLREYFSTNKDKKGKENSSNWGDELRSDKEDNSTAGTSSGTLNSSESVTADCAIIKSSSPAGKYCPSSRWGHTMCIISEKETVIIGGQGDKQNFCKDSLWHLNTEQQVWNKQDTSSAGPNPELRMGHTAVYDSMVRSIYVFGGSKNKKWFNDVHMLDVNDWKWQLVKANGKAPSRAYHTSTLYRHELWIFGGVFPQPDPQPDGCSNDLYVFSPIQESWYMPIVMGEKPTARSGHSATLLEDKLVVFGGWDMPIVFGELHLLDLTFIEWSQPKTKGSPPSPRSWHASCALSGNRMLIHGGYDGNVALSDSFIFNLDTMEWTQITMAESIPFRAGHTAVCLPYNPSYLQNDCIWLFGGGDNDGSFYDDLINLMLPRNVHNKEDKTFKSRSNFLTEAINL